MIEPVTIGIRDLRNTLSATIARVRAGETVTVTDRDRPVALIVPLRGATLVDRLAALEAGGVVTWAGGKPSGSPNPPRVGGGCISDIVVEDRR